MHRGARFDKRVILFQLSTKVDPLLQVRLAGCEFATDGEISSPSFTPMRHAYLEFGLKISREELLADFLQPQLEMLIHSMTDNVKEAAVAACLSYSSCDFMTIFSSAYQRTYVDNRNMRRRIVCHLVHIATTCYLQYLTDLGVNLGVRSCLLYQGLFANRLSVA